MWIPVPILLNGSYWWFVVYQIILLVVDIADIAVGWKTCMLLLVGRGGWRWVFGSSVALSLLAVLPVRLYFVYLGGGANLTVPSIEAGILTAEFVFLEIVGCLIQALGFWTTYLGTSNNVRDLLSHAKYTCILRFWGVLPLMIIVLYTFSRPDDIGEEYLGAGSKNPRLRHGGVA